MATLPVTLPKDEKKLLPPPIPKKLDEMTTDQWDQYQKNAAKWYNVWAGKPKAALEKGKYLYHATPATNLGVIEKDGLLPRDPTWKKYNPKVKTPRFDSSKDGYLSMATKRSGAGAMGGNEIVLRMLIGDDIADWDFRVYGPTEVRTVKAIPPGRLQKFKDSTWTALVAAKASSAAKTS